MVLGMIEQQELMNEWESMTNNALMKSYYGNLFPLPVRLFFILATDPRFRSIMD